MTVWFTVKLEDRPGALARLATALGDRGVNITGIVGVAEDTEGELMLTTSNPTVTREVLTTLGIVFDDHDPTGEPDLTGASISDLRPGAAGRGSLG